MCPEPFVSRAKASPAKRNEKGYGDENELRPDQMLRSPSRSQSLSLSSMRLLFAIRGMQAVRLRSPSKKQKKKKR